jgi:hypothetical protein
MSTNKALTCLIAVCLGLLPAGGFAADTIHFREGGGTGYTDVTFDDTWIDPSNDNTHGGDSYAGIQCTAGGIASLIAVVDMFSELPPTSGGDEIQINSAALHLFRYQGASTTTLSIYRVTNGDWLPDSAGANENDASGLHAEVSSTTSWASGAFSSADWDDSEVATGPWGDDYNEELEYDVTDLVAAIYAAGENFGLAVKADGAIYGRASEHSLDYRPSLEITYEYVPSEYQLTVNSGSGDGSYAEEQEAEISADAAPSGYAFDCWVGDTACVDDVDDPTAIVTMPADDVEVTATYAESAGGGGTTVLVDWGDIAGNNAFDFSDWDNVFLGLYTSYTSDGPDGIGAGWTGTGMSGAVSGSTESFASGDVITVTWYNAAGSGSYTFTPRISFTDPDYYNAGTGGTWYDMTQGVCPAGQSITTTYTFTSGTAGDYDLVNVCRFTNDGEEMVMDKIELTGAGGGGPTYYTLTVNSGSGDGDYEENDVVNVSADAAPSGYAFDEWGGDIAHVDDVDDPTTTVTMPADDVTVTATYASLNTYALTVDSGSGDGTYTSQTVVEIHADSAPSGMAFYKWTGETDEVYDIHEADTTITMPADDVTVTAFYTAVWSDTVHFHEGGGEGYTNLAVDDTVIQAGNDNTSGDSASLTVSATNFGLVAIADLLTELPDQSEGNDISIEQATLHLYRYNAGSSSDTIYVYRVTTDWLFDDAGTNENDVSGLHAEVSSSTQWASGGFSTGDYDSAGGVSRAWVDNYEQECAIDVTGLVAGICSAGNNYGLCLKGTASLAMYSSENTKVDKRPSLEIVYSYGLPTPTYSLVVNDGSGDGEHEVNSEVNISADAAPSGMDFNMWIGDAATVSDIFDSSTTLTMPSGDAELTATYRPSGAPDDWWPTFNLFCADKFGAEVEPLAYDHWGSTLVFMSDDDSEWKHASETSAVVAFETNLPARSYIEYGTTAGYGSQTVVGDRYHYIHVVYLTGLDEDTTYHFRHVATDERDNTIYSSDKTFATATPANVVYVPGAMGSPPYSLSQSDKTYLVTQDIVSDGSVFEVGANNVTIDLDGHAITYNNADDDPNDSYGIESRYYSGLNVYNGVIKQGAGCNGGDANALGNSPAYIRSCSGGEVAGVTVDYIGAQISGFYMHYSNGSAVHHCVVLDRGGEMVDRHMGCDAIQGVATAHHNLVLRSRQRGVNAASDGEYYNNEIHLDSVTTNSFGIFAYDQENVRIHHNRIFGTGYLMIGVGTVSSCIDAEVDNNYIHLHEMEPDNRWPEYGAQSGGYCARVTWGGDNLSYHDNTMITYAQDGGMVRGTWFYSQDATTDLTCSDNIIKAVLLNEASDIQGGIVASGDGDATAPPQVYENNRVISNCCNLRLADDYGTGCNTRHYDNTYVKCGPSRPDYRTIQCGQGSTACKNHEIYDAAFEDGAGYDEFTFVGGGAHDFYAGWTLTVETEPYATVTVDDYLDTEVFSGQADQYGTVQARLIEYKQTAAGKTYHTPHEVTASLGGSNDTKGVTMDQAKTLEIPLD